MGTFWLFNYAVIFNKNSQMWVEDLGQLVTDYFITVNAQNYYLQLFTISITGELLRFRKCSES